MYAQLLKNTGRDEKAQMLKENFASKEEYAIKEVIQ